MRLLFSIVLASLLAVPAGAQQWNFVLILADDLGWADIGPYGADLHQTPNLDRLAGEGMRFTDFYAAAPICSPTRASIMTGKYPARLQMTIWREGTLREPPNRKLVHATARSDLPLSEVTLAEVLHKAGYLTAHVGKWHLGGPDYYPENQGFDINVGGTHWGAPQTFFWPYRGDRRYGGEDRYVPGLYWGKEGDYLTDDLTDAALDVIENAGSQPFFLNLCYYTVHTPIEGKPEAVARYRSRLQPGLNHQNPTYAAMVESLDENTGRVLRKLEEKGIADNTVVIFTSDNGGFVNDYEGETVTNNYPLRSGKGSLYEGGIRVPLIVRWPGVTEAGAESGVPAMTADLYPTLLDIAGLEGDPGHQPDGLSLALVLRDSSARLERDALHFHYPHYYPTTTPVGAIRAGDWKLLEYFEDGHVELYNLAENIGEARDLSSERPDLARELRARLATWRGEVLAAMPRPNVDYSE